MLQINPHLNEETEQKSVNPSTLTVTSLSPTKDTEKEV